MQALVYAQMRFTAKNAPVQAMQRRPDVAGQGPTVELGSKAGFLGQRWGDKRSSLHGGSNRRYRDQDAFYALTSAFELRDIAPE